MPVKASIHLFFNVHIRHTEREKGLLMDANETEACGHCSLHSTRETCTARRKELLPQNQYLKSMTSSCAVFSSYLVSSYQTVK